MYNKAKEVHEKTPEKIEEERPTPSNYRSTTSTPVFDSDDELYQDDKILIDDGVPAEVPLEALAGPALVLPSNDLLLDGRTLNEDEFDWDGKDDDDDEQDMKEEEEKKKKSGAFNNSSIFICMSRNSSHIAWSCIVLFGLILIAIDVAIFVSFKRRVSTTSYGLELWFTWFAFMWCIAFMSQIIVELVPWIIKKFVAVVRPQSIEVLPTRLSVSVYLLFYI